MRYALLNPYWSFEGSIYFSCREPHLPLELGTAPSYWFWRFPPPELRAPKALADAVRGSAGQLVLIGPHPSTTAVATLHKLGADIAVL